MCAVTVSGDDNSPQQLEVPPSFCSRATHPATKRRKHGVWVPPTVDTVTAEPMATHSARQLCNSVCNDIVSGSGGHSDGQWRREDPPSSLVTSETWGGCVRRVPLTPIVTSQPRPSRVELLSPRVEYDDGPGVSQSARGRTLREPSAGDCADPTPETAQVQHPKLRRSNTGNYPSTANDSTSSAETIAPDNVARKFTP